MPQTAKTDMTSSEAADMFYGSLKNPEPRFNGARLFANQLKQGGKKLKDRELILRMQNDLPGFKDRYNITDLTEPPPASKVADAARGAASKLAEKPEVQKRGKALGKLTDLVTESIKSDPMITLGVTAARHPLTPVSEQILGPGKNLESAVRAGNTAFAEGTKGVPSAVTALPRFAQEMVAQGAATVDQLQSPAGMAAIVLGVTPLGGILGKAMPWLQKLATSAVAGGKGWDVLGDVASMEEGISPELAARTVSDVGTLGLSLLGFKGSRTQPPPKAAEISSPGQPTAATPPALPPGQGLTVIPKGMTAEEKQWQEMPVTALKDKASDILRKMRGVHGETSPYTTPTERSRATVNLNQTLDRLNRHIVAKGGTPVEAPPPAPGGPSQGKINLQTEAGKTSTGLPPGAPPPRSLPPGQYEMPGNRGELTTGDQTLRGPQVAEFPGFSMPKANRIAQQHGIQPDHVLEMSRQSNEDLKNAANQLIFLRGQISKASGSETYIEQLTRHINAITEVLLERDRVPTSAPPK
jgi:hypothetical protein